MEFPFRYLALIRGIPPKCANVRVAQVWMESSVEVPELTPKELPLACVVDVGRGRHAFRYSNGRFYTPVYGGEGSSNPNGATIPWADQEFGAATGIQRRMAFASANRWMTAIPLIKEPVWPREARQDLFVDYARLRLGIPTEVDERPGIDLRIPRADFRHIRSPDASDVEFHKDLAARLAEGIVMVDGLLWTEVPEPYLCAAPGVAEAVMLSDRILLSEPSVSASGQPGPFGNRTCDLGPLYNGYWRWDGTSFPIDGHGDIDIRLHEVGYAPPPGAQQRSIEVHIDGIWGTGHGAFELMRIARASCAYLHDRVMTLRDREQGRPGLPPWVPRELRSIFSEMLDVANGHPSRADLGAVASVAQKLAAFIEADPLIGMGDRNSERPDSMISRYWSQVPAVSAALKRAVALYDDSPVEMHSITTAPSDSIA